MEEDVEQLRAENTALRAENTELRTDLAAALARIAQIEDHVAVLEKTKTPPPAFVKKNTLSPAEPRQRKKREAAQNKGRERATPTEIVQHAYERCPDCGYALRGGHVADRRQVIELPPPAAVQVIEHQRISRHCPACGTAQIPPTTVVAGAAVGQSRFGVRVTSLIVYLRTVARLPVRTIQEYLHALHGLTMSVGGIIGLLHQVGTTTTTTVDALREQARASPVAHMDETGWREGGQNGYVWCLATPGPAAVRLYTYNPSRAGAVAREILGSFRGYLGTDFYGGYNATLGGKHQRCWAHLLRDLHALRETHLADTLPAAEVRRWVRQLRALFRLARWVLRRTPALCCDDRRALATRLDRRMQILCLRYAQQKGHPCQTLAQRLLRHQGEVFPFVYVDGLAPDNNLAERSIRPLVIGRKISGGTRSPEGSATRMALTSLCATWRARGLNPFLQCLALLSAKTPVPQV
jgi:transposase